MKTCALALLFILDLQASQAAHLRRISAKIAGANASTGANASAGANASTGANSSKGANASTSSLANVTFPGYYEKHDKSGRGMWKWDQYLQVYQRHFAYFAGQAVDVLEIGVQSGGSINMFESVLGSKCHYYGMDVNKNCMKFNDTTTTIFIGDQGDGLTWTRFFKTVVGTLDVVVDDGGHMAYQMLTTLKEVLPHLKVGGSLATEDIHGQNDDYLSKFLHPAADYIGAFQAGGGSLASVHIYPFLLLVQKAGGHEKDIFASVAPPATTVDSIPALMTALPSHQGKTVALANPAWPSFISSDSLRNLFATFYDLFTGVVTQHPAQCHNRDDTTDCTMRVQNSAQQNMISGVHISPSVVLVELVASPPTIFAVRKGSQWIPYNGP